RPVHVDSDVAVVLLILVPAEPGQVALAKDVLRLAVATEDGARRFSRLSGELLALVRQVAVAVAVEVECLAVLDQPDARLSLGAEDEQAVARLLLVGRLLADRAVNLGQVSGLRRRPREKEAERCQQPSAKSCHDFTS